MRSLGKRPKRRFLLFPVALFYWGLSWWREFFYKVGFFIVRRVTVPIVSLGNLSMGGTGKTPATIFTAQLLISEGYQVCVLSRGYRRRSTGTVLVSDGRKRLVGVGEAGDEPTLIASRLPHLPVLVDEDRYRGATALIERFSPDVILLDDAFQHRGLARQCDLVLLDATAPAWTYKIFPYGNLRETLAALKRASLVVWTRTELGDPPPEILSWLERLAVPQASSEVVICPELVQVATGKRVPADGLENASVLAFCGIAQPKQFYDSLFNLGIEPRTVRFYGNHHTYTRKDQADLAALAADGHDLIVTTEKDAVKLDQEFSSSPSLHTLRIDFALTGPSLETYLAILHSCLPPPPSDRAAGQA